MLILSIIFGAMLLGAGLVLCFTPLQGFLQIGQIIGIAMAVFGITGLVQSIINRSFRADFFLSLLTVIAAVFMLHDPLMQFMTDTFVLYLAASWLVIEGVAAICLAVFSKKKFLSRWWLILIIGILHLLLGIYSFIYPLVGMELLGLMVAFYFIDAGLSMILFGFVFRERI